MDQKENATQCMIEWLSDERELGKKPYQIKIADEFDLHDLHYYIFKFKKSRFSPWLVGVCGGYEKDGIGHCGHIYSEFKEYHLETAKQHCIDMVEMIRDYWINEAKKHQVPEAKKTFVDFVLLQSADISLKDIIVSLQSRLKIENIEEHDDNIYVATIGETLISLSLMDMKVPEGEAEYYAQGCYMWEDAVNEVKKHQAHIIVSTLAKGISTIEAKLIQSQLIDACLNVKGAIGVYGDEMVWPTHIYHSIMEDYYNEEQLPILIWVYLGMITNDQGHHIYTLGLKAFGHYEIETLPSSLPLSQLHEFMYNIVCYIIEEGAVLHDGETIGMSASHKCQIHLSQGLFLDEDTLKIDVVENERDSTFH